MFQAREEMMTGSGTRPPVLRVTSPAGQTRRITLDGTRCTVGRNAPHHEPDLALEPDPQGWISRLHLVLDLEEGQWWATGHGRNGTLLRHEAQEPEATAALAPVPPLITLTTRTVLRHGDTLLIPGDTTADGARRYWKLTYITDRDTVMAPASPPSLHYDWATSRIYRVDADRYLPVEVRPMCHRLLRHMVSRGDRGVVGEVSCGYAELIEALWDDPVEMRDARRTDLAHLVYEVRRRVEDDPANPRILETVRGIGYRLRIHPPGAPARTDTGT